MKYDVVTTSRFRKEYKLAEKRGLPMDLLEKVIKLLAQGDPLPINNRDHTLRGHYEGCRECHIGPDWLLVYLIEEDILVLTLLRTGSHSDLFV